MNKKGYTLAETLTTLTIIGVVAALTLPMINKFKPDINKAKFLNVHTALTTIFNEISNNKTLFPLMYQDIDGNGNFGNVFRNSTGAPFYNLNSVTYKNTEYSAGRIKLCEILADSFNAFDNNSCENFVADNNTDITDANFQDRIYFTTPQGIQFSMNTILPSDNAGLDYYQTTLVFDVNGDEAPNCSYSANTCPEPDRFKLLVSANGHIVASDSMSQEYLRTRTDMKKSAINNANMPQEITNLHEQWQIKIPQEQ